MTWPLILWLACCLSAFGGFLLCVLFTAGKLRDAREKRLLLHERIRGGLSIIPDATVRTAVAVRIYGLSGIHVLDRLPSPDDFRKHMRLVKGGKP